MRYFVSDLHFFHKLAYEKYRSEFSTIADSNEEIVRVWNNTVHPKDIVYVLGDVTFGKYEETKQIIQRLKGRKILIRGNHDERFSSRTFVELGFEDVRDTYVFKKDGKKWILSHFPYSSSIRFFWHNLINRYWRNRNESNYYKLYLSYKGYKLIHGHHHEGPLYKFDQIDVAWDLSRKLWNENEIQELFKKNEPSRIGRIFKTLKAILW